MIPLKLQKAGSRLLLACLLLVAGCNNKKQKPDNPQNVNEHTDSNKAGSTARINTLQPGEHTFVIDISKMTFNPPQLRVHKGDTVVWVNNDLTNHCVTDTGKAWTSSTIEPGKFWKKVIDKTEEYFCAIHLVMKGKIKAE